MATAIIHAQAISRRGRKNHHVLGPATADGTLIEYGDFECPYSRDGTRNAIILRERFGDRVQMVTEVCDVSKRNDIERVVAECAKALGGRGQRR